jgi:plasmid maintenance system antidote protein VapI
MTMQEKLRVLTSDMTRTRVCRRAGLDRNTLWRLIERGDRTTTEVAVRLAMALGVAPGWLIDDRRDWPPERENAPSGRDRNPASRVA